jgi:tetratricopeptide (TPR) repeat protein
MDARNSKGASEEQLRSALADLERAPGDPRLSARAGVILHRLGRPSEALPFLEQATSAAPLAPGPWYYLAAAARAAGEEAEADRALARFDDLAPHDAAGYAYRAELLLDGGAPERALEAAGRGLDLAPDPDLRGTLRHLRADCFERMGDLPARLRELEAWAGEDPANPAALAELGHTQSLLKRPVTVLPALEKAVVADPDDPDAWHALGAAANRMGDYGRARTALEHAVSLGGGAASHRELGGALQQLGAHGDAVRELQQALTDESDPGHRSWIHHGLAYSYTALREPERALEHYRAASEIDPTDWSAHQGLGAAYAELLDNDSALRHLETAATLGGEMPGPWYAFGYRLWQTGEWERARKALERAIALQFEDGRPRALLADVCHRLGDHQAGKSHARRALRHKLPRKWRAWVAGLADG